MTKLSAKKRQNGFVEVPEPAYLFFKFSFGIWLRRYVTGAFVKRVSEACFSIDPVNYRSQGAYFCRSCVHWDRHIDGFYYQTREISRNYMEIIAFWAKTRSIILIFFNIFFLYFKTWLRTRKVIGTFKKRPQGFDWYQTWLFCAICEFFFSKLTTTTSSRCFVSLAQLSVQLMISFALYLSFLGMKFCAVSSSRWIKEVALKWKFIKINKPLKQFRKDSIFSCIVCYLSVGCNPSFSYITTSQKKEK